MEVLMDTPSNRNALIGGIVGGVFFLSILLGIGVGYLLLRRRQRKWRVDIHMAALGEIEQLPKSKYEISPGEVTIKEKLGEGNFGQIFLAEWRNSSCVAKTFKSPEGDVEKELQVLLSIRPHPNICRMFGFCRNPFQIISEYLPQGSLDTLLLKTEKEISIEELVSIASDVSSGMQHLHNENILHCDLAARNLLVDQRVTDFGQSHILPTAQSDYLVNSETKFPIRWSGPEVLLQHTFYKASDVWSFAVVLWEVCERKIPYWEIEKSSEVIEFVCDKGGRLPKPKRVMPDDLWNVMEQCWNAKHQERPSFVSISEKLKEISQKIQPEEALEELDPTQDCVDTYEYHPFGPKSVVS